MCTDPISGNIWTHAKLNLMMYQPHKESRYDNIMSYCTTCTCIYVILYLFRNVWRIYLDQERFEQAQKYAEVSSLKLSLLRYTCTHYYTFNNYYNYN